MLNKRWYACPVCRWQGLLEPTEPGGGAMCENCGVLVYPAPWAGTWGVAALILGAVALLVLAVVYFRAGFPWPG